MVKNMTALMIASWHGNIKIVKDLIETGADVNARLADGRTALILAAEKGQTQCVELLIKAGSDVNITADISLPRSKRMKSTQKESDGEKVNSNQLGHSHGAAADLPAKTEDEASTNGGNGATVPDPTPSIAIKQEVQEILIDDEDDDSNDRHSDARNGASSSTGEGSPIELPSANKVDNASSPMMTKVIGGRTQERFKTRRVDTCGKIIKCIPKKIFKNGVMFHKCSYPKCKFTRKSWGAIDTHIMSEHLNLKYVCRECDKELTSSDGLRRHMQFFQDVKEKFTPTYDNFSR